MVSYNRWCLLMTPSWTLSQKKGTTNAIFVVLLMQEKCLSVNTQAMIIMLNKVTTERSRELLVKHKL